MDGHYRSLLKRLSEGYEGDWEKISCAVERGEIPRNLALGALEQCLKSKIPAYQHNIDTHEADPTKPGSEQTNGDGFGYWHGKLSEAVKAIRKIKETERGHSPNIMYKGKSV